MEGDQLVLSVRLVGDWVLARPPEGLDSFLATERDDEDTEQQHADCELQRFETRGVRSHCCYFLCIVDLSALCITVAVRSRQLVVLCVTHALHTS